MSVEEYQKLEDILMEQFDLSDVITVSRNSVDDADPQSYSDDESDQNVVEENVDTDAAQPPIISFAPELASKNPRAAKSGISKDSSDNSDLRPVVGNPEYDREDKALAELINSSNLLDNYSRLVAELRSSLFSR